MAVAPELGVQHHVELSVEVVPAFLGGDHSVAWPVAETLAKHRRDRWGIVQPDAHTDLLAERLGIKYCFATWSYHANELLGRDGRLVQVGVRASRHPRQHWESTLGVRQFWADEIRRDPERALDDVIAHLQKLAVTGVYFSNDIDGTDAKHAEVARLQQELERASTQARHDPLTGTLNRKGLDEAMEREIARSRRLGSPLCLALLDIDNFKSINDRLGHTRATLPWCTWPRSPAR